MSYGLTANDWIDPAADVHGGPAAVPVLDYGQGPLLADASPRLAERSAIIPVLFSIPVAISALSYAGDGVGFLSDAAFLVLTLLCAWFLAVELATFGKRQGLGAILIYGGVLVWFCHDYAVSWFNHDYRHFDPFFPNVKADTVARALFYHTLFIDLMLIGFRLPVARVPFVRLIDRFVVVVPEPAQTRFYFYSVLAALLIGWCAFIPTRDLWPVSIVKAGLWFVPGVGHVEFTAGRSGNINFNWGGYLGQVIQIGSVGGILGAVYALLVATNIAGRAFGWFTWAFWTSYSFQGDRRGEIAFMALPILILLFMLYHAESDAERRRRNTRWLVGTLAAAVFMWYAVQRQIATPRGPRGRPVVQAQRQLHVFRGAQPVAADPRQGGVRLRHLPRLADPSPSARHALVVRHRTHPPHPLDHQADRGVRPPLLRPGQPRPAGRRDRRHDRHHRPRPGPSGTGTSATDRPASLRAACSSAG